MIRQNLKYVIAIALAVAALCVARYLDNQPYQVAADPQLTREREDFYATWAWEETQTLPEETLATETAPVETEPAERSPTRQRFLLTFVGDCTLGSNPVNYNAGLGFIKTVGEDYAYPFANVAAYFENDDFTMVNLEGALCDEGSPVVKTHTFRGPTSYVNILTENSVEAVTLANNHTEDYGETGYRTTLQTLDTAGVPYVERDSSLLFTTESGLTIGVYAAVYYAIDVEDMRQEIAQLRQDGAEIVVFAPHWGYEHNFRPHHEQIEVGHAAIDAGADIVYGSHPHVLQPIEEYNGGIIYYSLGNFSFGGNIYPADFDTALVQQEVIREVDGSITLGELIVVPCSVSSDSSRNNFQPTPYEEGSEEYSRVLSKLDGTWHIVSLPVG